MMPASKDRGSAPKRAPREVLFKPWLIIELLKVCREAEAFIAVGGIWFPSARRARQLLRRLARLAIEGEEILQQQDPRETLVVRQRRTQTIVPPPPPAPKKKEAKKK